MFEEIKVLDGAYLYARGESSILTDWVTERALGK